MLQCLSFKSNSSAASPTATNLHSYPLPLSQVQTDSYNEIRSRIQIFNPDSNNHTVQDHDQDQDQVLHVDDDAEDSNWQPLSQMLHPDRECVEEALRHAKPNNLTRLVSIYFDHSETTSHLCLQLYQSVNRARAMYAPLYDLLDLLPVETNSISQSQCDRAFEGFLQFDRHDNPFPPADSHNFNDMRRCFSQLKQQLDHRLHKSRSRIRFLRRATNGYALCLIGTTVGVVVTAAAITTHALVALVACPFCPAYLPRPKATKKKELARLAQLDAAAKGTFVLNNDLDTIDRLVARLNTVVEGDKLLIRLGLERGRDKHPIQEVIKQLRRNQENFLHQLNDLEEHICLFFNTVNRARSLLLQEICLHQTCNS
ncbi:UPF0496 protein [Quillaja saponaria]|uniref:UPF0496 protein n=1 Tax=Quillaja saponaria TaxID=32244 RepID=A0AAD7Q7H7_QUISA|nr:UPF0496 protein [Quillaja saponaria]